MIFISAHSLYVITVTVHEFLYCKAKDARIKPEKVAHKMQNPVCVGTANSGIRA